MSRIEKKPFTLIRSKRERHRFFYGPDKKDGAGGIRMNGVVCQNSLIEQIRHLILSERTIVIGLGNPDRADDGVGIAVVSKWKTRLCGRAFWEGETSVETVVFDGLDNPNVDTFLFVDAADFRGSPGAIRLFNPDDASRFCSTISTHKVPLDLFMQMITSKNKKAFLLGVQPGSVELFGAMTEEVKKTLLRLTRKRKATA